MSKIFRYGYCSEINSVYRQLPDSLHTSPFETHYHEQIKIYNKNKPLIKDLKKEEKIIIHNKVYSKIKSLLIKIIEDNRKERNIFQNIYYIFHFILIFRTRKAVSHIIRSVIIR